MNIVYVCIDKDSDGYMDVRGKRLYKEAVRLLMPLVNDALETRDVIFHFDQNLGVSIGDLSEIAKQGLEGRNIKAVKKVQSHDNKCVQLADFVAGSIRSKYESNEDSYYELIAKKVSFAHEP
ncbi:DUF3800 domain-containing protein [Methanomassiliicoccales archaeon LGM-RCC1]|nr:DUF3800 domain-containing protein [Methanomassiliicoccales archaeon LGM-RCC1]